MTKNLLVRLIFLLYTLLFSIAVTATESVTETQFTQGKEKSVVCMTCHGVDGISTIDTYPNLQGQKQAYFVAALKAYKLRQRNDGLAILMHAQADVLSDKDMHDIAFYFNQVKSAPPKSDD
ncbi:cytochrome C [Photobacterium kishitanii]|uniref:Cytochrome C n=1 Tax=Photobacterium kishitanii TaxID=318456 RepID=A0A2T3KID2_9GAMM|nr:cytochrome c [Photobacterium kishitanii]OBU20531.1 cytochrome C [Photobacterium kishitanii]OBU28070.1 cytochrome C [Photobacterium kishitanii]PSU19862.1 cytochrome C [Photobacterium kishitanii]PSU87943.1 cytochrome C [Photobacterium kishitanii]PSU93737.1 cytochrome C [Photobacterium kishitanii]